MASQQVREKSAKEILSLSWLRTLIFWWIDSHCIWNLDKAICLSLVIKSVRHSINKHSSDGVEKSFLCYYLIDFREGKKHHLFVLSLLPCLEQSISRVTSTSCLSDFQLLTRSCPPLHCLSETLSCLQARYHLCSSLLFIFLSACLLLFFVSFFSFFSHYLYLFALSPNVFSVFLSVPRLLWLTILVYSLWPYLKPALQTWCCVLSKLLLHFIKFEMFTGNNQEQILLLHASHWHFNESKSN